MQEQIFKLFVELVLPALLTAIAGYVVAFLRTQAAKAKIALSAEQDERLRGLAFDAAQAVEELARQQIKTTNTPMDSDEKAETAIDMMQTATKVTYGTARRVLHSVLGDIRTAATK